MLRTTHECPRGRVEIADQFLDRFFFEIGFAAIALFKFVT